MAPNRYQQRVDSHEPNRLEVFDAPRCAIQNLPHSDHRDSEHCRATTSANRGDSNRMPNQLSAPRLKTKTGVDRSSSAFEHRAPIDYVHPESIALGLW